jgi:hypothetical protein
MWCWRTHSPPQELGYYQRKRLEEHRARVAAQQKKEKRTMEKLMRQVEQGTQLTGEAQEWMEKKMKEDPSFADKMNVRAQAKKSLRSATKRALSNTQKSPTI